MFSIAKAISSSGTPKVSSWATTALIEESSKSTANPGSMILSNKIWKTTSIKPAAIKIPVHTVKTSLKSIYPPRIFLNWTQ